MRRSPEYMPLPRSLEYHIQRAFTWAESVFKTDIRYLLRGGFWGVAGQIVSSFSALALSIAFSRLLPKEIYGEYKFILAFVSVIGALSLNGLGTAIFQASARGMGGALPEGFKTNLRWSFLVYLGSFLAAAYYLYHGNSTLGIGILIGGCFSPLITSANLYSPFLSGKKDFRRFTLYGFANTVVPAVALIITVFFTRSVIALLAVYFISNTLVGLLLYRLASQHYRSELRIRDASATPYAKHLSAIGILALIAGNIDQLFLFHYLGAIEVALYNFAIGVLDQSKGIFKMLDVMVQARFASGEARTIRDGMRNKMLWLFLISIVVIILYVLAAPYIYEFLFPTYLGSVLYSQVYAISLLAIFVNPANSYIAAKKKIKEQYISSILNSVIQIGAIVIGIYFWGLWGLIIARVIFRLSGAAVTLFLYEIAIRKDTALAS
jgi:O-antigen/teichoic acid export membrane protein